MNFLSCIDPFIGKIDKHSLSQQTIMELLIEGITDRERICGSKENPKDISEWEKLGFNDASEVKVIGWYNWDLKGSIDFQWLPLSTKKVFLFYNHLTGSADLTCLPDELEILSIGGNQFEGTVDLTKLPSSLEKLSIHENNFYGHTDFSQLPKTLVVLNVSGTQLEGEVCNFDGELVIFGSNVTDKRIE